jgi:hypothetical protein
MARRAPADLLHAGFVVLAEARRKPVARQNSIEDLIRCFLVGSGCASVLVDQSGRSAGGAKPTAWQA